MARTMTSSEDRALEALMTRSGGKHPSIDPAARAEVFPNAAPPSIEDGDEREASMSPSSKKNKKKHKNGNNKNSNSNNSKINNINNNNNTSKTLREEPTVTNLRDYKKTRSQLTFFKQQEGCRDNTTGASAAAASARTTNRRSSLAATRLQRNMQSERLRKTMEDLYGAASDSGGEDATTTEATATTPTTTTTTEPAPPPPTTTTEGRNRSRKNGGSSSSSRRAGEDKPTPTEGRDRSRRRGGSSNRPSSSSADRNNRSRTRSRTLSRGKHERRRGKHSGKPKTRPGDAVVDTDGSERSLDILGISTHSIDSGLANNNSNKNCDSLSHFMTSQDLDRAGNGTSGNRKNGNNPSSSATIATTATADTARKSNTSNNNISVTTGVVQRSLKTCERRIQINRNSYRTMQMNNNSINNNDSSMLLSSKSDHPYSSPGSNRRATYRVSRRRRTSLAGTGGEDTNGSTSLRGIAQAGSNNPNGSNGSLNRHTFHGEKVWPGSLVPHSPPKTPKGSVTERRLQRKQRRQQQQQQQQQQNKETPDHCLPAPPLTPHQNGHDSMPTTPHSAVNRRPQRKGRSRRRASYAGVGDSRSIANAAAVAGLSASDHNVAVHSPCGGGGGGEDNNESSFSPTDAEAATSLAEAAASMAKAAASMAKAAASANGNTPETAAAAGSSSSQLARAAASMAKAAASTSATACSTPETAATSGSSSQLATPYSVLQNQRFKLSSKTYSDRLMIATNDSEKTPMDSLSKILNDEKQLSSSSSSLEREPRVAVQLPLSLLKIPFGGDDDESVEDEEAAAEKSLKKKKGFGKSVAKSMKKQAQNTKRKIERQITKMSAMQ